MTCVPERRVIYLCQEWGWCVTYLCQEWGSCVTYLRQSEVGVSPTCVRITSASESGSRVIYLCQADMPLTCERIRVTCHLPVSE